MSGGEIRGSAVDDRAGGGVIRTGTGESAVGSGAEGRVIEDEADGGVVYCGFEIDAVGGRFTGDVTVAVGQRVILEVS